MSEKMTLEQVREAIAGYGDGGGFYEKIGITTLIDWKNAIDAHLAQPAQPCPYIASSDEGTHYCRLAESAQPAQAVDAWMTEDGRVISDRQKATALKDSGASASSVAPYSIPLTRALSGEKAGPVDGWKLVPVEPTQEMIDRGTDEHECEQGDSYYRAPSLSDTDAIAIYKAMLSASPAPDKEG